jgi:predicted ATPase/DNA-binding SARP family transcriptional activator
VLRTWSVLAESADFGLLGPLMVHREGVELQLGGPKQRALLAILLLEANHAVSADRLIDALWGDHPPDTAKNTLQVYISQLRKLLPEGALETVPFGYRFAVTSEALDLARFEELAEQGRAALAVGDAATAAQALGAALALWRGPALADVAFEEFAQADAARLEELRLAVLEDRIEADLALGRHAPLVAELERLISENPFRERLRAQLMLALYRSGRQAEALAVYQRTRRALVDELGIEPGESLRQIEQAILAHDPALDAPEGGGTAERVPIPTTPLLGRERELAALADLFRGDDVRLVTLTGIGGIGKTRLALELVRLLAPEFRDGARMADLATIHDPTLVARTILQALDLPDAGPDAEDALLRALAEAELLLLVDNFEQALEAAPTVARLVQSAPRVKVVATSRAPLRVAAEHEFAVPPLADDEAAELFAERAQAANPSFLVSEQNAAAVAELCRRLDGLPLAIELAAARTKLLAPLALLKRLGNRLELLTGGRRDAPQRQQTLRATLDWSHDLLAEDEQQLFARLAVFEGGCRLGSVEAVCGNGAAVLDSLAGLVNESLVRQQGTEEVRFSMLETVREYALERLSASAEEDEIRRRHLDHFLTLAEAAEPELFGTDQITWFARLEDEHDNLRAALAFALDAADPAAALRLAVAVRRFWSIHSHLAEGRDALERALAASPDEPTALRARALNTVGIIAGEQGDFDASRERLEAALRTARAADAPDSVSAALTNLGNLAFFRGELDAARELYVESIDHFASLEDIRGQALSKENLGRLELAAGDVPKAVRWLTEARDLARDAGVDHEIAATSRSLAAALIELDETDRARKLLAESLALSREIGEPHGVAVCLDTFAGLAAVVGDPERAAMLFGASDAVRSSIGALRLPDDQILYDGWLALALARLDTATYSARYDEGHELALDEACAYALAGSAVMAS